MGEGPMQPRLDNFVVKSGRSTPRYTGRKKAFSFFDPTGCGVRAWALRGYDCVAIDANPETDSAPGSVKIVKRSIDSTVAIRRFLKRHSGDVAFCCALPPCKDLCSVGARYWKKKDEAYKMLHGSDADFQKDAVQRLKSIYSTLRGTGAPFFIAIPANPIVKKHWRPPDLVFSPYEYGAYISAPDIHPVHHEIVPPRDAYKKRTFLFIGNGLKLPHRNSVDPVKVTIRLRDGTTKAVCPLLAKRNRKHARRLLPRGLCEAIAQIHASDLIIH